jgi:glycosyltransferase involved in cell wall biosynthesis
MSLPYFSIIMPTHGRPQLLRRAIASLRASSFQDFELIVISDQTDAPTFAVSAEMLTEKDTFIKRTGKPGPAESRNLGLEKARGQYVIFLDDDDALLPGYMQEAFVHCQKNPGEVLFTNYRVIEEDRERAEAPVKITDISVAGQPIPEVYVKNFIHNHTCLYPVNALKGRRQDEHLASLDDWDFLLNVMSDTVFRHLNISGPVIYKDYVNMGNRRGSSASAQGTQVVLDYLHIYRRWPAPDDSLRKKRQALLQSAGLGVPLEWL